MVIVNDVETAKRLSNAVVKEYESGLSYKEALQKVVWQYQQSKEHKNKFNDSISQFKN